MFSSTQAVSKVFWATIALFAGLCSFVTTYAVLLATVPEFQGAYSAYLEDVAEGKAEFAHESYSRIVPGANGNQSETPLVDNKQAITEYLSVKYAKEPALISAVVAAAWEEAHAHGVSPLLVIAIIEQESGFRHKVVNAYGAMGLMQVVPRWHPEKVSVHGTKSALLDPEVNVKVGTKILAEYLNAKQGNLRKALAKYSGGASAYYEKVASFERKLREVLLKNRQAQVSAAKEAA